MELFKYALARPIMGRVDTTADISIVIPIHDIEKHIGGVQNVRVVDFYREGSDVKLQLYIDFEMASDGE